MSRSKLIGFIVALAVAAGACGTAQADTVAPPTETSTTNTTTTTAPEGPQRGGRPARSLEEVEAAVVQIVAVGSFATPQGELVNSPGSGTGFVIDGAGLAVTNNHVVTGAAYLEVYVAGEDDPRNARVVAVSECTDLAIVDIDGDFEIYLDWYEGAVAPGLEIFVAGFPLGDPEYTLYEGIVAKTNSGGDSAWASVDDELEHTADTIAGNSGSPIVTIDGAVIGVHYASGAYGQAYGITLPAARDTADLLSGGLDVDSIGVNGEAFITEGGSSGIWVSSVESGSSAANAGILPGDIITRLENLILSTDGTMADYCDILRGHDASDPLSVEVIRLDTGEVLEGTLNGAALEVTGSLGGGSETGGADEPSPDGYVMVSHHTGALVMDVPVGWNDIDEGGWKIDGERVGKRLAASPDMEAWHSTFATPGVQFSASATLADLHTPESFLATLPAWTDCTYDGRSDYDDGLYVGLTDRWVDCGSTGATFIELVAIAEDGSHLAFVEIIEVDESDRAATERVLSSFLALGSL